MAQRLPSTDFASALADTLEREDPDVLEVEGIELAQYLFQSAAGRGPSQRPLLVFDDHNAEYVLQQRAFQTDARLLFSLGTGAARRWLGAPYSYVQWQRLRTYERRACETADRVVAVSRPDAEALRRLVPGLEPVVVPNGVDSAHYSGSPAPIQGDGMHSGQAPSDQDLVFTGKMDFRPNVDAVLWFAQEVLPLIRRERPDVRFWVVGKDPHPRLAPLQQDPGVKVTGYVDDVRPYIASAAIYVIPLRIGGGTRLKVLEAMAMGKAIVSTAVGCEGFDLVPGRELATADDADGFAQAVLELLDDPSRRDELGRTASEYAATRYDWHMIVPLLEEVYRAP
jgi:glycosyltransferase involved in cell wall biosynthesis